MEIRRVVVGWDDEGAPGVLMDGPAPATMAFPPSVGASVADLWRSETVPLGTVGTADATDAPFVLMPPGSLFRVIDLEPGDHAPLWHLTATVDFNYVAAGSISLLTGDEADPTVTDVAAGDTVVVRGVRHAWRNGGTETCRLVSSSVAATLPIGVEPG